jgi:hypothetical protein
MFHPLYTACPISSSAEHSVQPNSGLPQDAIYSLVIPSLALQAGERKGSQTKVLEMMT